MTNNRLILLTNDDGVDAAGLCALESAASRCGQTITVAPREELSGCGHRVTIDRPLSLDETGPQRFALDGTPADCVRLGLLHVAPQTSWVLAGINEGGNLGVDIHMSGTIAAVREAVLFGRPAIAVSQFRRRKRPVPWELATRWTGRVLDELLSATPVPGTFWNVNLPDAQDVDGEPEIVYCPLEPQHLNVAYEQRPDGLFYRGSYQQRPRTPGSDVDVCFSGRIAVTQIAAHSCITP
jgi:5'-nucleotidase